MASYDVSVVTPSDIYGNVGSRRNRIDELVIETGSRQLTGDRSA